jgi:cytochrome c553
VVVESSRSSSKASVYNRRSNPAVCAMLARQMPQRLALAALVVVVLLVIAACKKESAPPSSGPVPPATPAPAAQPVLTTTTIANQSEAAYDARKYFRNRCQVCHGEDGKGDGPGAAALNPKPRDYTNAAWQMSVTDDYLMKIIVKGGAAVGKSPGMPPNPDLESKADTVREIVKIVRSFKGK